MRPFQEFYHNVSVRAAVCPEAAEHPPDLVLAQLGLQLSGGEPIVLIPRLWSLSVSGDMIANNVYGNCPVSTKIHICYVVVVILLTKCLPY